MMKRIITLLLMLVLFIPTTFAESISLDGLSYSELVALKDRINLAIWESNEWQEVTVPQGVWKVGEDIPAGHWTVKCAPDCRSTWIQWGQYLKPNGEEIKYEGVYGDKQYVYNPSHNRFEVDDGITEYSFEVCEGHYIVIEEAPAIFMPYAGKPNLGFK